MRRMIDIIVAGLGLVLSAPLLLVIALMVWIKLGRPVLFRQVRTGFAGRQFPIIKFRTMRQAEYPGESDADRTPPLGQRLRAWSLDELPQLWNVLVGDMSVIGPRPTLPEQVVHYDAFQRRRLETRPGITGYAQIRGRNALPWPERIELDVWYIDHRSVLLDLWIIATTAAKVVRRTGITGEGGINPEFPAAQASVEPAD